MKILTAVLFLALWSIGLANAQNPSPVPHEGTFIHKETGVIFPEEIAGMKILSVTDWGSSELGISPRYVGEDGVKADIYIYDRGIEDLKDDPEHADILEELGRAAREIEAVAEQIGVYADVEISTEATISVFPDASDPQLTTISLPVSFRVVDQPNNRRTPGPRTSLISVGIYDGFFFKLRHTFRSDHEDAEAMAEAQKEMSHEWAGYIAETKHRDKVRQLIKGLFADPLSEKSRASGAEILSYAEESSLVQLTINAAAMPWMTVDDYPRSELLLLASLAGSMEKQFETGEFVDQPVNAMKRALEVYAQLREKEKAPELAEMEKFQAALTKGELEEAIEAAFAAPKSN
ncbi:MAG: hypothetical protein AAF585_02335 [Verrucomicrobiota bacterium]